jgi:hypothetical protein
VLEKPRGMDVKVNVVGGKENDVSKARIMTCPGK